MFDRRPPDVEDRGIFPGHRRPAAGKAALIFVVEILWPVEEERLFGQRGIVEIGELKDEAFHEGGRGPGDQPWVVVQRAGQKLAVEPGGVGRLCQRMDHRGVTCTPAKNVGIVRHHRPDDRVRIPALRIIADLAHHLDPGGGAGGAVGGQRGQPQRVGLRTERDPRQFRPRPRQPVDSCDRVDRMRFTRRDQIGRVGRQVAGQKRRSQKLAVGQIVDDRGQDIAAQRQQDLHLAVLHQLADALARKPRVIAAVERHKAQGMPPPADQKTAGAIDAFGPDLAAVQARQAPGLNRTAQRRQETDSNRLRHPRRQARQGAADGHPLGKTSCTHHASLGVSPPMPIILRKRSPSGK